MSSLFNTPIFFIESKGEIDGVAVFLNELFPEYQKWHKLKNGRSKTPQNTVANHLFGFSNNVRSKLPKEILTKVGLQTIKGSLEPKKNRNMSFTPFMLCTFLDYLLAYTYHDDLREKIQKKLLCADHYPQIKRRELINFKDSFALVKINAHAIKEHLGKEPKQLNDYIKALCKVLDVDNKTEDMLLFDENWRSGFIKEHKYLPSVNTTNNRGSLKNDLSEFYSQLQKEYSTIELLAPRFSLPIEQMIHLSLKKNNSKKQNLLQELETEITILQDKKNENQERLTELEGLVNELKKELSEKHEIVPILNSGSNVFIHGQGGSGKSTLLRWIVFAYGNRIINPTSDTIPVFIELRFYEAKSGVIELIKSFLETYNLDIEYLERFKFVLLIDGYDEFSGDSKKLLDELNKLRIKYKPQIVFSGRSVPKLDSNYTVYSLNPFKFNDIQKLCFSVLGESDGKRLVDIIDQKQLSEKLKRPLYLVFVLMYAKQYNGTPFFNHIERMVVNIGRLFEHVIVEQYLKIYEDDDSQNWITVKNKQVSIISELAFKLINRENPTLNFSQVEADLCFRDIEEPAIKINSTLNQFVKHGILLNNKNGKFSFAKKEIRNFFAARHLKEIIKSHDSFRRVQRKMKGTKWIWDSIYSFKNDSWMSVENYLFGLIDANLVINQKSEQKVKGRYIISNSFLDNIRNSLKLIDCENPPTHSAFKSKQDVFQAIKEFSELAPLKEYVHISQHGYRYLTSSFIRRLLVWNKNFHVLFSRPHIDKINRTALDYGGVNMERAKYFLFRQLFHRNIISNKFGELVTLIFQLQDSFSKGEYGSDILYIFKDRENLIEITDNELDKLFFDYFLNRDEGLLQIRRNSIWHIVENLLMIHQYSFFERLFCTYRNYPKQDFIKIFPEFRQHIIAYIWLEYKQMNESMQNGFRAFFFNLYSADYFPVYSLDRFAIFISKYCDKDCQKVVISDALDYSSREINTGNVYRMSVFYNLLNIDLEEKETYVSFFISLLEKCKSDINRLYLIRILIHNISDGRLREQKDKILSALFPYFLQEQPTTIRKEIINHLALNKILPSQNYLTVMYGMLNKNDCVEEIIELFGKCRFDDGVECLKKLLTDDTHKFHAFFSLFRIDYSCYHEYEELFFEDIKRLNLKLEFVKKEQLVLSENELMEMLPTILYIGNESTWEKLSWHGYHYLPLKLKEEFKRVKSLLFWKLEKIKYE